MPADAFDSAAIERELRRLLNDWRTDRGLQAFTHADGHVVADLNEMASDHSERMAGVDATIHEIDNRSSAGRYRDYELYHTCKFQTDPQGYMLKPENNRFEVLARTDAGKLREGPDGTAFHGDETAVARAVFENWRSDDVFGDRLSYRNANRIGIGIEITGGNEVFVTGTVCGV